MSPFPSIRVAVALRGDLWTLGLPVHDPRGHRTIIAEQHATLEWFASSRYRRLRKLGYSIAAASGALSN